MPAQYALGYQYFYGLGTKRNRIEAIEWFKRSAEHSMQAQYALYLINEDAPLEPWRFQLN